MDSHPNFHGYCHCRDHSGQQSGQIYDESHGGGLAKDWSYETGVDVSYFQPAPIFESEHSGSQSSFTTDYTSLQSSSPTAFRCGGNNYCDSMRVPHEAIEADNWPPTSDAIVGDPNSCQENIYGTGMAICASARTIVSPYNLQPPPIISPSTITNHQLRNEHLLSPIYPAQQDFEPLLDEESRENPPNNNSLKSNEISPQQTKCTRHSRLQPPTKKRPQAQRFFCYIRPCNHHKAFTRKSDLERHSKSQHPQFYTSAKTPCGWPGCAETFFRRDKMLQHQDKAHEPRSG